MSTIEIYVLARRGATGGPRHLYSSILLAAFLIYLQPAVAQQSMSGTPGVATQQAVVNFTDLAQQEVLAPAIPREPKVIHSPIPVPHNLPVPSDVIVPHEEPTASVPETEPTFAPSSPLPSSSFLALEDNNTAIPPDTHGAIGPNHLMVMLNSQVRIQNRTGGVISTVSLEGFWASLGPFTTDSGAFDPKVLYDPFGNRWMFTACADPSAATSSLLIGVSQTSDPTGTWNLYRVDGDAADLVWVDYPSMGFNKDWIAVQVNMFNLSGSSSSDFNRSHIYVFNKANLYAGGAGSFTLFSDSTIGGTQVPAITHDNTLSTLYMLNNWNSNFNGSGYLRLFTITGTVGAEVFTLGSFVSTPNPWDFAPPGGADFAPQLGSTQRIQTNDARMQNLVYRNGSLWTVHTVFLSAGGSPTRSAIQWWELTTAGTIIQRNRIDDVTGNIFYAFPSIAVNKNNDVLIGYSRFSATQYASANYSFRAASDPLNTLQADTVLKAGEAPYYKIFGGTENRWGDYSNTVVDPVNDTDMWTIQEYAATPSEGFDRWGTWWGRIATTPTLSVSPTSLTFGSVTVGSTKDLTSTVTNSGSGTLTGSVTTSSPYSIVSGSSFSLTAGASQAVTVRFSPTSTGTFLGTATVSSNGGSASVSLSGTGTAPADTIPPTVTITTPTSASIYITSSSPLTVGGTASDNVGVTQVTWSNAATGTSGTASGTTSWTASGITLLSGTNLITVTAKDAAGNTGTNILR